MDYDTTMAFATQNDAQDENAGLAGFIARHRPLFILTGAGCSTASGIPDYRDRQGEWKHRKPIQFQDFCGRESGRKRYWSRSLVGWPPVAAAQPGPVHLALRRLEGAGLVRMLVTQNVDGLHRQAGSRRVLDLHGTLATVSCLTCRFRLSRHLMQQWLAAANPGFGAACRDLAPDGDADLDTRALHDFRLVHCPRCGGILKPDVVFFGEAVPGQRVRRAMAQLEQASAMLVLGSSLMVYSGYRFCRAATAAGKPIWAVNLGRTRADGELAVKIEADCGETLAGALQQLGI